MDTCSDAFFLFLATPFSGVVPKSISVGMASVKIVVKFLRTLVVTT